MPLHFPSLEDELHAAEVDQLEHRILQLALQRTRSRSGALFLVEDDALKLDFHIVDGVTVNLPGTVLRRRHDGRPNGIAFRVLDTNRPCLVNDTRHDPDYARYFLDVRSIAGVPIRYQDRPIGVLTVSSPDPGAFSERDIAELEALAASSAKFIRRAQLFRAKHKEEGREILIKGLSPEWIEVERTIERVAASNVPVLIRGETGTGKELVANSIHFNSRRSRAPFVVVNIAAIPGTLLESALFGHARGAFTGAIAARVGEFERAHGGTIFLDEVGDLDPALQVKLLRTLESGEIQPLGAPRPKKVDVRVICATNRDLEAMMRQGSFRVDLYYRISVVTVELPPLRRFKHNLEIIAQAFLQLAARRHERPVHRISPAALALLRRYDFPGNLRELRNIIERAVLLAEGDTIQPEDLPRHLGSPAPAAPRRSFPPLQEVRRRTLEPVEREYLTRLLEESGGDVGEAARMAGVNRVTLYRLMRRHGISLKRKPV